MTFLVILGALLTLAGLAGLGYCIVRGTRLRRSGLEGPALHSALQRLVAVNMGALALSFFGLLMVALGAILS